MARLAPVLEDSIKSRREDNPCKGGKEGDGLDETTERLSACQGTAYSSMKK